MDEKNRVDEHEDLKRAFIQLSEIIKSLGDLISDFYNSLFPTNEKEAYKKESKKKKYRISQRVVLSKYFYKKRRTYRVQHRG